MWAATCGGAGIPIKTGGVSCRLYAIGGESNVTTNPVDSVEEWHGGDFHGQPPHWDASAALPSPQAGLHAVTINNSAVWVVSHQQPPCAKGVGLCLSYLGPSGWTPVLTAGGTLPPALTAGWAWFGAACSMSRSIVVAGGGPPHHEGAALKFDTRTRVWSALPSLMQRRWGHALVAVGERMFVLGGIYNVNKTLAFQLSSCEMLEEGTSSWVKAPPLPVPRMAHAAGVIGTKIIVAGGYCGLNEGIGGAPCPQEGLGQSVIILDTADLATARWQNFRPMLASRFGHAVAVAGNILFALGGGFEDRPAATTPTVEAYDLVLNEWRAAPNMSTPRFQLAAAAVCAESA